MASDCCGGGGVPVAVADQGPFPAELTALTCTSYACRRSARLAHMCRDPEPAVQTSSSTVQLASDLSLAALSICRRS